MLDERALQRVAPFASRPTLNVSMAAVRHRPPELPVNLPIAAHGQGDSDYLPI